MESQELLWKSKYKLFYGTSAIKTVSEKLVNFGISSSTCYKCIKRVCHALCGIRHTIIKWPDEDAQNRTAAEVEEQYNIPNVIGYIDGTHIRLSLKLEDDCINRNGFASVNVQLIVDNELKVIDCYAGWPGASRDARIFRNSNYIPCLAERRCSFRAKKFSHW